MVSKLLTSLVTPAVKWAAKELAQNQFLREYIKARALGANAKTAYEKASFATADQSGTCPTCGALKEDRQLSAIS